MLLAVTMLFLVACGSNGGTDSTTSPNTNTSASPNESASSPSATPSMVVQSEGFIEGGGFEGDANEAVNLAEHIDIILRGDFVVLNPSMSAGNNPMPHRFVHDRLVDHLQTGVFTPQLAERWETDDYKTWKFYLRNDVTWHNGAHFTADDVKFTIEFALENVGSLIYNRFRYVESINVIDDYTIELTLIDPNVDILFEFANFGGATILSRKAYEDNSEDPMWASIGTGPFRVSEFVSSSYCKLERFDEFWGEAPPTKSLTLWVVPEQATRTVMLQNGEAQVTGGEGTALTAEDLDKFVANPDFQVFSTQGVSPTCVSFNNMGNEVVMDKNFRLAIAHGIDCEDVALAAAGNWAVPVWDGNIWGAGVQFRMEGLPKLEYDPELAKEYLAKSAYKGETLKLSISGVSVAAEVIQMQLGEIGISIEIDTMDGPSFIDLHKWDPDNDNNARQMHLFAVAGNPSALRTLRTGMYPLSATNRLNYSSPRITELTDLFSSTDDETIRRDAVYEIQEIIYEDLPAVPIYYQYTTHVAVNGIGGVILNNDPFANCYRYIFWDLDKAPASLKP